MHIIISWDIQRNRVDEATLRACAAFGPSEVLAARASRADQPSPRLATANEGGRARRIGSEECVRRVVGERPEDGEGDDADQEEDAEEAELDREPRRPRDLAHVAPRVGQSTPQMTPASTRAASVSPANMKGNISARRTRGSSASGTSAPRD